MELKYLIIPCSMDSSLRTINMLESFNCTNKGQLKSFFGSLRDNDKQKVVEPYIYHLEKPDTPGSVQFRLNTTPVLDLNKELVSTGNSALKWSLDEFIEIISAGVVKVQFDIVPFEYVDHWMLSKSSMYNYVNGPVNIIKNEGEALNQVIDAIFPHLEKKLITYQQLIFLADTNLSMMSHVSDLSYTDTVSQKTYSWKYILMNLQSLFTGQREIPYLKKTMMHEILHTIGCRDYYGDNHFTGPWEIMSAGDGVNWGNMTTCLRDFYLGTHYVHDIVIPGTYNLLPLNQYYIDVYLQNHSLVDEHFWLLPGAYRVRMNGMEETYYIEYRSEKNDSACTMRGRYGLLIYKVTEYMQSSVAFNSMQMICYPPVNQSQFQPNIDSVLFNKTTAPNKMRLPIAFDGTVLTKPVPASLINANEPCFCIEDITGGDDDKSAISFTITGPTTSAVIIDEDHAIWHMNGKHVFSDFIIGSQAGSIQVDVILDCAEIECEKGIKLLPGTELRLYVKGRCNIWANDKNHVIQLGDNSKLMVLANGSSPNRHLTLGNSAINKSEVIIEGKGDLYVEKVGVEFYGKQCIDIDREFTINDSMIYCHGNTQKTAMRVSSCRLINNGDLSIFNEGSGVCLTTRREISLDWGSSLSMAKNAPIKFNDYISCGRLTRIFISKSSSIVFLNDTDIRYLRCCFITKLTGILLCEEDDTEEKEEKGTDSNYSFTFLLSEELPYRSKELSYLVHFLIPASTMSGSEIWIGDEGDVRFKVPLEGNDICESGIWVVEASLLEWEDENQMELFNLSLHDNNEILDAAHVEGELIQMNGRRIWITFEGSNERMWYLISYDKDHKVNGILFGRYERPVYWTKGLDEAGFITSQLVEE